MESEDAIISKTRQPEWGTWLLPLLEEGKREGRKEVVEFTWLFNRDITLNQMRATNLYQEQLKEWGIGIR